MSGSHDVFHAFDVNTLIFTELCTNTFKPIDFSTCAHSYILSSHTEWNERNNNHFLIFHHFSDVHCIWGEEEDF